MTPIIEALIFIGASIVCALLLNEGLRVKHNRKKDSVLVGTITWLERRR